MRSPLVAPFALLLVAALPAQLLPRDSWVVATIPSIFAPPGPGGIYWLSADRLTFTAFSNQSTNLVNANCVEVDPESGLLYIGTTSGGGGLIYSVLATGTSVITETLISTTAPDGGSVSGIALRRDQLWYVTSGTSGTKGVIGYVPKAGGAPVNVFTMTAPQVNGLGNALACNGRELYIGTSTSALDLTNIWVLDPEEATPTLRGLALIPILTGTASPSPGQMFMAESAELFVSDFTGFMHKLNTVNATWTTLNPTARAPQLSGNGGLLNPWTDTALLVPGAGSTPRQLQVFDNVAKTWSAPSTFVGTGAGVGAVFARPFLHFNKGCLGTNGLEPRVGVAGLSALGNMSFALTLRNVAATTPAFLLLGASNTFGLGVPLPYDLTPLNAPGCKLLTSSEISFLVTTTSTGEATQALPIPLNTALSGVVLHLQGVQPSGVNGLGLVFSDGGTIRLR